MEFIIGFTIWVTVGAISTVLGIFILEKRDVLRSDLGFIIIASLLGFLTTFLLLFVMLENWIEGKSNSDGVLLKRKVFFKDGD